MQDAGLEWYDRSFTVSQSAYACNDVLVRHPQKGAKVSARLAALRSCSIIYGTAIVHRQLAKIHYDKRVEEVRALLLNEESKFR